MRLVVKESERQTQTEQKQSFFFSIVKAMHCKFHNHCLIDFTEWHHTRTSGLHATHNNLYKYLSVTAVSVLKTDHNMGRTQDWPAQGFVTCLACLSMILLQLIQICSQKVDKNPL